MSKEQKLEIEERDQQYKKYSANLNAGAIYFFRSIENTGYAFDTSEFWVTIDKKNYGGFGRYSYIRVDIPPGKHRLRILALCGYEEYDIEVVSGKIYYWGERSLNEKGRTLGPSVTTFWGGGCNRREYMKEYDESSARIELQKCKPQL